MHANASFVPRVRRPIGVALLLTGGLLMVAPMMYLSEYATPDAKMRASTYTTAATIAFGGLVLGAAGWSLSNFSPLASIPMPIYAAALRCRRCRSIEPTRNTFCSQCDAPL